MKKIQKLLLLFIFVILVSSFVGCGIVTVPQDNNTPDSENNDTPIDSNDTISDNKQPIDIDFSQLTYCAFGDSITWGYDNGVRLENPYPTLVANTLGLKSYKNAGISGSTLVENIDGLTCIVNTAKAEKAQYDIISVMGGVNDYHRNAPLGKFGDTTTSTIYGSLDTLVKLLRQDNPNAFIFFMTPFKDNWHGVNCTTNNNAGYNLSDVAKAIKDVCEKYNIPVLDMYETSQYEVYGMYVDGSDMLHPRQDYITQYASPQIVRFIQENYGK